MAFELNAGQGNLFRVAEKKNERGPDYEGKVNIEGTVYRLAGWIKEGRSGKYLSLKADVPRHAQAGDIGAPAKYQGSIAQAAKDVDADIDW